MKITIKYDPNKKFLDVEPQRLAMACGVLTHWAISPEFMEDTAYEALNAQYRFPMLPMSGCEVDEVGDMRYPGDPVQHPFCRIRRLDETIYIYANSVVSIVTKLSTVVVRMD